MAWGLIRCANKAVASKKNPLVQGRMASKNLFSFILTGYPRNPFNDVICNDVISASGVFTAKELCRLSKGTVTSTKKRHIFTNFSIVASIMTGASSMHGNTTSGVTSSQGLNGVKLESQYYCNSYTPPTPVDHGGLLPPSYSKLNFYFGA